MNELNKLAKYKPESFFEKIKRKILSFFKKEENTEQESVYAKEIIIPDNVNKKEKEEFFELYNKIKNNEIELNTLDESVLYKVMIMLNEELELNSRKIDDQIRIISININNLKVANSSIQLLNKG